ncbi:MAG: hypothetical protein ACE5H0_11430, partial [Bacteroidota bacterium]
HRSKNGMSKVYAYRPDEFPLDFLENSSVVFEVQNLIGCQDSLNRSENTQQRNSLFKSTDGVKSQIGIRAETVI